MEETNVTIFNLEDEELEFYILGSNIKNIFSICENNEEKGFIINYLLTEMMKMMRQIDSQKFPKKGILFFIGDLEDVYKWYVYFFKNHFCLSFEILKSIFHIVRTTLQCLASMTDMNGYECAAFISCWHCMEFLIMNQHISK